MWSKVSFKGVIIGALADIIGTNIWGFIAVGYLASKYHLENLSGVEGMRQISQLSIHDPVIGVLNFIIGGAFTVLGGYIAARIAKKDELLNGTLASFLCVLFALLAISYTSIVWVIVGVVINPLLGLAGGYLRLWQKRIS